jgi:DHA3 family macrolide efflux protein-like MFS transporter
MSLACALFGLLSIALGVLGDFRLYLAAMAIMGLTLPLYNTPSMVLFQTKVEPAYMGRVFGVFGMVASLVMPAGMLLFGPLGDVISIDWLLVGSGAVVMLLAIPFLTDKVMREVYNNAKKPIILY